MGRRSSRETAILCNALAPLVNSSRVVTAAQIASSDALQPPTGVTPCATLADVNIGAITKQLAQEALGNQVKEVVDSLSDSGAPKETAPDPDNLTAVILGQVNAMQNALKDDQELVVTCTVGHATLRVHELFAPSSRMIVVTGTDAADRAITRIITAAASLQLICKPTAVKPDLKPVRVRLVTPKAK